MMVVLGAGPVRGQNAITVDGIIRSTSGGFKFPDGSIQTTAATGRAAVPKTGQTFCWSQEGDPITCPSSGQDGEFQTGVARPSPRFVDNGDGTVTDALTGLIWLQDADCFGEETWEDALGEIVFLNSGLRTCANYTAGTTQGWRLPNIRELLSLIDFGEVGPGLPAGHPFLNHTLMRAYWSSDTRNTPGYRDYGWLLYFDDEVTIDNLVVGPSVKSETELVWPVRGPVVGGVGLVLPGVPTLSATGVVESTAGGLAFPDGTIQVAAAAVSTAPAPVADSGQRGCWDASGASIVCKSTGQDGELQTGVDWASPRFLQHPEGTVTDTLTGLMWLQNAGCFGLRDWQDALDRITLLNAGAATCTGYSTGTYSDWRLPNVLELFSLIDFGEDDPALPPGHPFENVLSPGYWSSTTFIDISDRAWSVEISTGVLTGNGYKNATRFVWPVRGGM